jgi:hypothetical protein
VDAVDDRIPARVFVSAGVSKSYPAILFPDRKHRSRHLDLDDKRVGNVSQCLAPNMSHLLLLRSGLHKIFLLDARTGVVQLIADLSGERKNMKLKQESIALGIASDDSMFAVWRNSNDCLKLSRLSSNGRSPAGLFDLGELYRSLASR